MTPPTHYEILGVAADAERETIRRAYVAIARATHPDRASVDPSARADASRTIRAANAAWNVLGDERRRAEYDRRLLGVPPPARSTTAAPRTRVVSGRPGPPEPPPTRASGAGWLAVVLILVVAIGIVVASAYAVADDPAPTSASSSTTVLRFAVGDCVDVGFSGTGRVATVVPCDRAVTGRVLAVVDSPRPCPSGSPIELADNRTTLCLAPV